MASIRRIRVPLDLDASLAVFKRHLQNLIGQVRVRIQLIQHLGEELSLERKVIPAAALRQIRPAWIDTLEYCPFEPGISRSPRKSSLFLVTSTQSSASRSRFNSQSFQPDLPIHTT